MNIRYRVDLTQDERSQLMSMLSGGKHGSRILKRAQILLAADGGAGDAEIERCVGTSGSTIYRTKRRFVEGDLEAALSEQARRGAERKLTGKEEALLVATACSAPPQGRKRWTLELLADEVVRLSEHDAVSRETVRRRLQNPDAFSLRELDEVTVKGRVQPLRIYEVLDALPEEVRSQRERARGDYYAGLKALRAGDLDAARRHFEAVLAVDSEDASARVLWGRCQAAS